MSETAYVGGELELFARARHWKHYWSSVIEPYIGVNVLEVGAGIGSNTVLLRKPRHQTWVSLEPDPKLVAQLSETIGATFPEGSCEIRTGILAMLPSEQRFDTILYIDVLEHIEDDAGEVRRAAEHLESGGRLIVLSPAHPKLFSEFDRSIGHFRRYTTDMLRTLTPSSLQLAKAFYLDSIGMLASSANRWLLGQPLPTARQIAVWDNFMVPCSRILDPLTFHRIGKTVIAIWEKLSDLQSGPIHESTPSPQPSPEGRGGTTSSAGCKMNAI